MKWILIAITTLTALEATANQCRQASNELKAIRNRMGGNSAQHGRLQAAIDQNRGVLQQIATTLPGWEHGNVSCGGISRTTQEAIEAIELAIQMVEASSINAAYLEKVLASLAEQSRGNPNFSLKQAILEYVNTWFILPSSRAFLLEIAKIFDLLEQRDSSWRKNEKAWIEAYLTDQKPLIEQLLIRLKSKHNQITHGIQQIEKDCQDRMTKVKELMDLKAKKEQEIQNMQAEQAALNAANAKLSGEMPGWQSVLNMCSRSMDRAPK